MKVLIDGVVYDSKETPVLIVFDDNEKEIFNMKRFVSAPEESTVEERQELIDTELIVERPYSKIEEPCFVCKAENKLGEERGTQSHPINCGWRVNRENKGYKKGLEDIINLCYLPKEGELKDLIDKIKKTAVMSYMGRYDMKDGD